MIRIFSRIRRRLIEGSRLRSYVLYGLGEVLLVVVGILIALQVDNWNGERQNDRLARACTARVIADLTRDTSVIGAYLAYTEEEIASWQRLHERLSADAATVDTLIRIARYEFDPVADQLPSFNNNTFRSIESSGNLTLLDPWLAEALVELDRIQKSAVEVEAVVNTLYYATSAREAARYPVSGSGNPWTGPLADLIWNDVDPAELAASFNALGGLKQVKVYWEGVVLREVLGQARLILSRLEERAAD